MLSSLDGKISTGDTDVMDFDADLKVIDGVKEGVQQYYDIEKTTDFFSLSSGRVFEKIGLNEKTEAPEKISGLNFVIIDNKPHLNEVAIRYACHKSERAIFVTNNKNHPAYKLKDEPNIEIIEYEKEIDFEDMFRRLKEDFGAQRVTIQTGGTLNAELLRSGMIDYVSIVIAPVLIGGKDTTTLIDGESLHSKGELSKIRALKLESSSTLKDSYFHLVYKVLN